MSFLLSPSPSPLAPLSRSLSDRETAGFPFPPRSSASAVGPFSLLKKMNRRSSGRPDERSDESDDGASLLRNSPILSPQLRSLHSPHISPSLPPFHNRDAHSASASAASTSAHLGLANFSPSFTSLSPHVSSALSPSPPLSSLSFAAPFPRSPRMTHSHIRDITGGASSASASSPSAAAAAAAAASSSFSFFSPSSTSRSPPKFGIYSSSLLNSPSTSFSLPSPPLSSLGKAVLEQRRSPRLTSIKEEQKEETAAAGALNSFLRGSLSISINEHRGKASRRQEQDDDDSDDSKTEGSRVKQEAEDDAKDDDGLRLGDSLLSSSPTFIMLQAVEAENNSNSGGGSGGSSKRHKRRLRQLTGRQDEDGDDDGDDGQREGDTRHRMRLKSSHTASLMLSHTPPLSFSHPSPTPLLIPLLTPLLSSLSPPSSESDTSAPSSPASSSSARLSNPSPPPAPDDSMLLQLEETATSMSALATLSTLGNGSSCHQCKSRRPVNQLMFCCNNKKRGHRSVHALLGTGEGRRPPCRKKFCDLCLAKFYDQHPSSQEMISSGSESRWQCPSCRGFCTCAACRRRKERTTPLPEAAAAAAAGGAGAGKGKVSTRGGGKKKLEEREEKEADADEDEEMSSDIVIKVEPQEANGSSALHAEEEPGSLLPHSAGSASDEAELQASLLSSRSGGSNGVQVVDFEPESAGSVIHISRQSIVFPPSYSPRSGPAAAATAATAASPPASMELELLR